MSYPQDRQIFEYVSHSQKWDDAIARNGLKEAGSSGQTLESRSTRGEERAKDNDPRGWPRESPYHQVTIHSLTKPVRTSREFSSTGLCAIEF